MRTKPALAAALTVALWVLAGCGDGQGKDPAPHADATATSSAVRIVDRAEADLVLHVSNQSFDDEEVRLTVKIDGVTVVDGDFHVEGQHNWASFPLALSPGGHEITADSDSGATLRESFRTSAGTPRYAVIDHWTEDGAGDLTWLFQREPLAFG